MGLRIHLAYSLKFLRAAALASTIFHAGCSTQTYQADPVNPQQLAQQRVVLDHQDPAFRAYLEEHQYPLEAWPLDRIDLAGLMLAAMYFNPALQLAESHIEIARTGETIAGQRPNPTVNFPDEPRDTADFYGLVVDFIFERQAKREARQAQATAAREAAEFELAQQAWSIYTKLHANLVEYYGADRASKLLKKQRAILKESLHFLTQRVEAGQASEFELSSLRLELRQTELLLSNQHYLSNDAFHRLIVDTGLQVDKFKHINFVFSDLKQHLQPDADEIQQLQTELLHSRFDIKQQLAEYQAYESALKLEIEKQYPDVTLSPGLLFEEGQALWVLAASAAFPLFHNNDGQIERALAERKRKQYEFIRLQTSLINELARKKQNYQDRLAAYDQSRQLVAALQSRGEEIEKQFKLGYSGKLALLRSRLEIEKAKQAMFQTELNVMRAAVQLEAVTQSPRRARIKAFDFMQPPQRLENKP
ncbi:MAG: TolC family protein [Gammaproteobacteria bacterium]